MPADIDAPVSGNRHPESAYALPAGRRPQSPARSCLSGRPDLQPAADPRRERRPPAGSGRNTRRPAATVRSGRFRRWPTSEAGCREWPTPGRGPSRSYRCSPERFSVRRRTACLVKIEGMESGAVFAKNVVDDRRIVAFSHFPIT
jgi:hypothetical protein